MRIGRLQTIDAAPIYADAATNANSTLIVLAPDSRLCLDEEPPTMTALADLEPIVESIGTIITTARDKTIVSGVKSDAPNLQVKEIYVAPLAVATGETTAQNTAPEVVLPTLKNRNRRAAASDEFDAAAAEVLAATTPLTFASFKLAEDRKARASTIHQASTDRFSRLTRIKGSSGLDDSFVYESK